MLNVTLSLDPDTVESPSILLLFYYKSNQTSISYFSVLTSKKEAPEGQGLGLFST